MRHGKKFNHLGRTSSHRAAMLSNMASSLIIHKRIVTTVAKAKALRVYVEPIITRSKEATTHNYRTAFSYLQDKVAVTELFTVVGGKVASRPGGYTRILKTGNRAGDNAEMAMIELVDFNEFFEGFNEDKKKSTTRRSRRGGASTPKTSAPKAEVAEAVVVATVIEDAVVETVVAEEVFAETVAEVAEEIVEVAAEEVVAETVVEVAAEEVVAAPTEEVAPEAPADETPEAPAAEEGSEEETK
ncbi:MAG: 50S ribosomal protein L17 [Flavobacteriales bacterium]|nr:MAG: 50S ribosomal protein L17 [Flavobacteriales bacterium]